MGNYKNVIFLAVVLAVVIGSIALMHIITSTRKFKDDPKRVPALCCSVFIVAVAALALVGIGVNSAGVVSGFRPFGTDGVSGAADLLEAPSGGGAGVADFSLAFYDGRFLNLSYSEVSGESARPLQITGSGQLHAGETAPAGTDAAIALPLLAKALRDLEALGWAKQLDLPGEGAVLLSSDAPAAPETVPAGARILYGGRLLAPGEAPQELLAREMPVLRYSAGDSSGSIFLADTL